MKDLKTRNEGCACRHLHLRGPWIFLSRQHRETWRAVPASKYPVSMPWISSEAIPSQPRASSWPGPVLCNALYLTSVCGTMYPKQWRIGKVVHPLDFDPRSTQQEQCECSPLLCSEQIPPLSLPFLLSGPLSDSRDDTRNPCHHCTLLDSVATCLAFGRHLASYLPTNHTHPTLWLSRIISKDHPA